MKYRWPMILAVAVWTTAHATPPAALISAAQSGDSAAQLELAEIYLHKNAADTNEAEAVKWLRKAAAQQNVKAQIDLGALYERGFLMDEPMPDESGADTDSYREQAIAWYRKAADLGDAYAQFRLGKLLARFGEAHQSEAIVWYRKAAGQELKLAQRELAELYAEGRDAKRDYAESLRWYRRLAQAGDKAAQFEVGFIYEHGRGVPADEAEALTWYRMAAAEPGNPSALAALHTPPGFSIPSCDFSQPSPKSFSASGTPSVLFDFPAASKPAKVRDAYMSAADTTGSHFYSTSVTATVYSSQVGRDTDRHENEWHIHGGGPAYFTTESKPDGSGSITVVWRDVGRAKTVVELVVAYANEESQRAACNIVGSAHLMDPIADITLSHVKADAERPYAWIRNIYGRERKVYEGDFVTRDAGKLHKIWPDHIEVIELLPNGTGGWKESAVLLWTGKQQAPH